MRMLFDNKILILATGLSSTIALVVASAEEDAGFLSMPLLPHHTVYRRALAEGDPKAQSMDALYQGYGTHYVDLWVGTPTPQRQTVIVDTGSAVTAFPCSGCGSQCGSPEYHIDNLFVEANSKSFHKLSCKECFRGSCTSGDSCRLGMSYQEGSSWTAYEARDLVYAGGPHDKPLVDDTAEKDEDPMHANAFTFPLTFGCQTDITGLFKTQLADGIMGMDNAPSSFWKQMVDKKAINKELFTMCFSRQPEASRGGTESGAMTLGGTDTRLHTTPMLWAQNVNSNRGFYSVHLRRMYLRKGGTGDESAATIFDNSNNDIVQLDINEQQLNTGGVIVDSGTTDTYMNRNIANAFTKVWNELAGRAFSHTPLDLTEEQVHALPTIILQFSGFETNGANGHVPGLSDEIDPENPFDVLVAVPAAHYMEFSHKEGKFVARFYVSEGGGSVLGGNFMMGHDVAFDVGSRKVGFAQSHCDYTKLRKGDFVGTIDTEAERVGAGGVTTTVPQTGANVGSEGYSNGGLDFSFASFADACNSDQCRTYAIGGLVGVVVVIGVLFGLWSRPRRGATYTEIELPEGDGERTSYTDDVEAPVDPRWSIDDDDDDLELPPVS